MLYINTLRFTRENLQLNPQIVNLTVNYFTLFSMTLLNLTIKQRLHQFKI